MKDFHLDAGFGTNDLRSAWLDVVQMDLLPMSKFMTFARERSVDFGWTEDDLKQLSEYWASGLLIADLVIGDEPDLAGDLGLVREDEFRGYLFSDNVAGIELGPDAKVARVSMLEGDHVELNFHPFRLLVLHQLKRMGKVTRDALLEGRGSSHHASTLRNWNGITTLATLIEPYTFSRVYGYHSIRRPIGIETEDYQKSFYDTLHGLRQHTGLLLRTIEVESVEELLGELCREAEWIEPNSKVLRLLRLTNGSFRLTDLKATLGLSMTILGAAECLRRAFETAHEKDFVEEDEAGYRWDRGSLKTYYYGSDRVLESNSAKVEFLRELGLDYTIRLRWYVEGDTEYHALSSEFENHPAVEVINLRGQFREGKNKGLAFAENLMGDMDRSVYSWISLDKDVSDNCRVVRTAAREGRMFGSYYFAEPDFEFENFSLNELTEIVWEIASERGAPSEARSALSEAVREAQSGAEFEKKVASSIPELAGFAKGPDWGRRLMRAARQNWKRPVHDGVKLRQLCDAVIRARHSIACNYLLARRECHINIVTGQIENNPDAD
jgi:hypothetical protein